jgi:hypothetical protein
MAITTMSPPIHEVWIKPISSVIHPPRYEPKAIPALKAAMFIADATSTTDYFSKWITRCYYEG